MPIGNLTSQIFANIYLNELDRFVVHGLRPKHYLRYGDDFILVDHDLERLMASRRAVIRFLAERMRLELSPGSDIILKAGRGLRFLGVVICPNERRLNRRNVKRIRKRLSLRNACSYFGLVDRHGCRMLAKELSWMTCDLLD